MAASNASVLNGERSELPAIRLIHTYFEDAVKRNEEKSKRNGVFYKGECTTYYEINERAKLMALNLSRILPNRTGDKRKPYVIGVDILPSPELVIAFLAILKCGATYLPLDTLLPSNRLKRIVAEVNPMLILVDNKSTHKLNHNRDICPDTNVVGVDELLNESMTLARGIPEHLVDNSEEDAVAAIIYTSGSAGVPIGVLIRHVSVINRLAWQWKTYPWQEEEVGCFKASISFVDHMVEVFSTTLKLVPMVIAEKGLVTHVDKFLDLLEMFKVTRLVFVPSLLRNIIAFASLSAEPRLPDLKLFISNSETLTPSLLKDFFNTFKGKRFANFYGSTETAADVTWETFDNLEDADKKSSDGKLSIGRPLQNSNLYIVDHRLQILPVGEVGEICLSGLNVASGFVDNTISAPFVLNPHSKEPEHLVLYRTGDYGRLDEGMIFYYGRHDTQVKIRGHRADTSEIERIVRNIPGVEAVTVLCHSLNQDDVFAVAYYVVKSGKEVTDDDVINACKMSLPSYMIPKPFQIEKMPLQGHTGKVDRQGLKKTFDKYRLKEINVSGEVEGLNEISASILRVISRVLNLPERSISLNRKFFEIGGNSVNAIETIVKLREQGLHITIDDFAQASSILDLFEKCSLECTGTQLSVDDEYEVIHMKDAENHEDVVAILTNSFAEKEPLGGIMGSRKEDWIPLCQAGHDLSMQSPSIVVRRRLDKTIVGGDVLCDFLGGEEKTVQCSPAIEAILALCDFIEDPIREKLSQEGAGPIMINFMLFVDVSLPGTEQIKLAYLLEEKVIEVAKKEGFKGIIATNTNKGVQDLCEHHFGYQLLTEMNPKDFEHKGTKPFSAAPPSYSVKTMIKYL